MKAWKAENGVEIRASYIGNHDDIQAKIASGGGEGADLITYYQGYKPLYTRARHPHDRSTRRRSRTSRACSRSVTESEASNLLVDADGTRTGVPWTFGAIGITWDDADACRAA